MTTLHPVTTPSSSPLSTSSTTAPTAIPPLVYRVHRSNSQTRYSFSTGFSAKNQTTIVNYTSALSRFGLAHLNQQTNISSPFISVYDSAAHAEAVARYFGERYQEDTWVVSVDPAHFARGPVFWAADLLREGGAEAESGKGSRSNRKKGKGGVVVEDAVDEWLHWGEYLVMYRIPAQAIRDQTPVSKVGDPLRRGVGVIGGGSGGGSGGAGARIDT
ncbi:hypothetical protein PSV08DRAFT_349352 [Bipolaris maydis]|nr:hypothetical protein J3E73DRAFT_367411 [Bipolaris maydis]KAJ6272665.1 hypothetical protein PSV08DRAFT_349352 [Bipolaris maydis]KAJ6279419.1 hypothetical protein J3E71DRAFT_243260 [Bipolaris maydis]